MQYEYCSLTEKVRNENYGENDGSETSVKKVSKVKFNFELPGHFLEKTERESNSLTLLQFH